LDPKLLGGLEAILKQAGVKLMWRGVIIIL
jgi:hypothetical protein